MQAPAIHKIIYLNKLEEQKLQINERGNRCGSLMYQFIHLRGFPAQLE